MECIVLSNDLVVSIGGKISDKEYRAVLCEDEHYGEGLIVKVEQPIRGNWHQAASWYLEDLLDEASDSICIDGGQAWNVESGMFEALQNAQRTQDGKQA